MHADSKICLIISNFQKLQVRACVCVGVCVCQGSWLRQGDYCVCNSIQSDSPLMHPSVCVPMCVFVRAGKQVLLFRGHTTVATVTLANQRG